MQATQRESGHIGEGDDGGRSPPHYLGAISDLTAAVVAPADHGPVHAKRAGVRESRSNGDRVAETGDDDGDRALRDGAIPELAGAVESPAADGAVGQDGAGMTVAGSDRYHIRQTAD